MENKKEKKRKDNEIEFDFWIENEDGSRKYWFETIGKYGWKARYVKEVDNKEITLKFYQEIYNSENQIVEIHIKYPQDLGHKKI
jgi:hypothetical protein